MKKKMQWNKNKVNVNNDEDKEKNIYNKTVSTTILQLRE